MTTGERTGSSASSIGRDDVLDRGGRRVVTCPRSEGATAVVGVKPLPTQKPHPTRQPGAGSWAPTLVSGSGQLFGATLAQNVGFFAALLVLTRGLVPAERGNGCIPDRDGALCRVCLRTRTRRDGDGVRLDPARVSPAAAYEPTADFGARVDRGCRGGGSPPRRSLADVGRAESRCRRCSCSGSVW